jgi:hypothetical protein
LIQLTFFFVLIQKRTKKIKPARLARPGGLDCLRACAENFQHFLFEAV